MDRVLEWEYGKYAVGYKCVTVNDNFFPGHFPQRAIMPGRPTVAAMRAGPSHVCGTSGPRQRHPRAAQRRLLRPPHAGVLQVEAMAQLGGIIMIDPADAAQQTNFFFGGVDNLRWRKPVVPGDVLVHRRPGALLLPLSFAPRKGCRMPHGACRRKLGHVLLADAAVALLLCR